MIGEGAAAGPVRPRAARGQMIGRLLLGILAVPRLRVRMGLEDKISAEMRSHMVAALADGSYDGIFIHCPNEGQRSPAAGALFRHIGLVPGAPDWWFMGPWGCGVLEFKVKQGRKSADDLLTDSQKDFRDWCRTFGVNHASCVSVQEAFTALHAWGAVRKRQEAS